MSDNKQLQTTSNNLPSSVQTTKIDFSFGGSIDLSDLPKDQADELRRRHAENLLALEERAIRTKIDIIGLNDNLNILNANAIKATQGGISMTAEQTLTSSSGKTTIIIGNTERAASGKLSGSMSGSSDTLLKIIIIVAIALVLIVLFLR